MIGPPPNARTILSGLVGRDLQTLTGRWNRVLRLVGDTVVVATQRSQDGRPVPLAEVQAGLDRLWRDRELEISVATVGYRSAFIGAVLATLPQAAIATRPRRISILRGGDTGATASEAAEVTWDLVPGTVIKRTALHQRFGGRRQGGIGPSRQTPNVFVFTDPKKGAQYGYHDRWEEAIFHYTGEGQVGPQKMTSGNLAILRHREQGRALRLFKGVGGEVRYLGAFELDEDPHYTANAPDANGDLRQVIVFKLRSTEFAVPRDEHTSINAPATAGAFGGGYRRANEHSSAKPRDPFSVDPNVVDRYTRGHAQTQNALADFLSDHGITPNSPSPSDPDFDLGWKSGGTWFVAEVKSLTAQNEARQLRLGLGQVLDYQDALLKRYARVRAVLAVERQPGDPRWVALCERHDVILVWPGTMDTLTSRILSA